MTAIEDHAFFLGGVIGRPVNGQRRLAVLFAEAGGRECFKRPVWREWMTGDAALLIRKMCKDGHVFRAVNLFEYPFPPHKRAVRGAHGVMEVSSRFHVDVASDDGEAFWSPPFKQVF